MKIISLGAGVQSSTVFMMSCLGELPKADAAIFADTGNEPAEVYRYLVWLKAQGDKYGIPVYEVSKSNLGEDTLAYIGGTSGSKWANLPVYMADNHLCREGQRRSDRIREDGISQAVLEIPRDGEGKYKCLTN